MLVVSKGFWRAAAQTKSWRREETSGSWGLLLVLKLQRWGYCCWAGRRISSPGPSSPSLTAVALETWAYPGVMMLLKHHHLLSEPNWAVSVCRQMVAAIGGPWPVTRSCAPGLGAMSCTLNPAVGTRGAESCQHMHVCAHMYVCICVHACACL